MSPLRTAGRRGLSLYQLLLLLALLAILFALLLPAVRNVRRAAERIQDSNNIKQICLGTINCADTNNGKLPPLAGPYPQADATAANNSYGSVFFHILPYLEQDNLYKKAFDGKTYHADHEGVWGFVIKVYLSPSDPSGGKEFVHDGWLAKSNYAANFQVFGDTRTPSLNGQSKYPASITDGTSNTIFFAQRYQVCNGDPCAWGYDAGTAWAPAFAYLSQGKFQTLPPAARCDSSLAQGLHEAGIMVGLGDGSTRLVNPEVSGTTWWAACTPAGDDLLGPDW